MLKLNFQKDKTCICPYRWHNNPCKFYNFLNVDTKECISLALRVMHLKVCENPKAVKHLANLTIDY